MIWPLFVFWPPFHLVPLTGMQGDCGVHYHTLALYGFARAVPTPWKFFLILAFINPNNLSAISMSSVAFPHMWHICYFGLVK